MINDEHLSETGKCGHQPSPIQISYNNGMFGKKKISVDHVAKYLAGIFVQDLIMAKLVRNFDPALTPEQTTNINREEVYLRWFVLGMALSQALEREDSIRTEIFIRVGNSASFHLSYLACPPDVEKSMYARKIHLGQVALSCPMSVAEVVYDQKQIAYQTALEPTASPVAFGATFFGFCGTEVADPGLSLLVKSWFVERVSSNAAYLEFVQRSFKITNSAT